MYELNKNEENVLGNLLLKLNVEEMITVNLTALKNDTKLSDAEVKKCLAALVEKGILHKDATAWKFKLLFFIQKGTATATLKDKIIMRTPAGTEIMSIFDFIERKIDKEARDRSDDDYFDDDLDEDDEFEDDAEPESSNQYVTEGESRWLTRGDVYDMSHAEIILWCEKYGIEKDRIPKMRQQLKKEIALRNQVPGPPELFFQYVKMKFTPNQLEDLTDRLTKLKGILVSTELTGQTALHENIAMQLSSMVREQEIAAFGLGTYLDKKFITLMKHKVPTLKYEKLENFPRVIPEEIRNKIIAIRLAEVFDEYKILYLDGSKINITTSAAKIKKKDPILFGTLKEHKDRLYFIVDWTDDFCDMTLDKMVGYIKEDDPKFALSVIGDVDKAYVDAAITRAEDKTKKLKDTDRRNYRRLMKEDSTEAKQREELARAQFALKTLDKDSYMQAIISVKGKSWFDGLVTATKTKIEKEIKEAEKATKKKTPRRRPGR